MRKLLKRKGQPPILLIADKLRSYPAAKGETNCASRIAPR